MVQPEPGTGMGAWERAHSGRLMSRSVVLQSAFLPYDDMQRTDRSTRGTKCAP